MNQETRTKTNDADDSMLQRMGSALANWAEKWFPDAYVFAAIAVLNCWRRP